jgi:hypothetical protein
LIKSLAETIKTSSSGTVDATAMATKMVDRKGPGGPHHGGPRPTDLLEQLQNGDLTKLLQSRYTQASTATTRGLQVDQYA